MGSVRVPSELLRGLTESQRAAVERDDAPLCVIAPAGSGKTRVLTSRVARRVLDGSSDPRRVVVATFTRKAAWELRHRLSGIGAAASRGSGARAGEVRAGTFHSLAYAELRRQWDLDGVRTPRLVNGPRALMGAVVDVGGSKDEAADRASTVAGEISWAQARMIPPAEYERVAEAARRRVADPGGVAEAYERYVCAKAERNVLDMDDLLVRAAEIVERYPQRAEVLRWRFRHFFVDEFQDVNPAQWRLLRAWLGDRDDLFLVGDPRQAIYAWNGSDPGLIERIQELMPATTVMDLDANHRCSPQVLAAATAVLANDGGSPASTVKITSTCPDGPAPVVSSFEDERAEAFAAVRWLKQNRLPGSSWAGSAILARTNSRLEAATSVLSECGIPFQLASDRKASASRSAAVLRLLGEVPGDRPVRSAVSEMLARDESRTLTRAELRHLTETVDELVSDVPTATVRDFLSWLSASSSGEVDLFGSLATFEGIGCGSTPDMGVEERTGEGAAGACPSPGRVAVSTFHRAKGLEWRSVAVVGMEEGVVPIAYASSAAAMDEERRLLYVALTRARSDLWCSWSENRSTAEGMRACRPSRFVAAVRAASQSERRERSEEDLALLFAHLRSRLAVA